MAKLTVKTVGFNRLAKKLDAMGKRGQDAMASGLYAAGVTIMRDSKRRVPVDLGTLRGSGYVTLPRDNSSGTQVEIGYGGPSSEYAIRQHEDTSLNHPNGGEAKFLENAVNQQAGNAARAAARAANESFSKERRLSGGALPTDPNQGGEG